MIEVLEKVKQAYDKSTTQIDRIIVDKNPYRITNADYNDDCYENGNIFGTAIARMLEFEIENSINLEKKEFEYQTGIYIDDKIFWISLGNFIVQDVEPNNTTNKNKVTSMDYMLKSNIKYNSKLDYKSGKITMLDVVKEGCQQSGLELATTDFANNDFIVDSNQFSEDTLIRQVFQAAAQMSGTFAKIRSDNKLYFITPKRKGLLVKEVHKMTVAELNKLPVEKLAACENNYSLSSYKELIVKRNTHPINLVSLGMSDVEGENITLRDEESIAKDGENSLVINDNPFAYTQEKREQLITALFNVVKGFEYTAFEITGQAKPYIETGDEVVAKDKEGNLNHSFLFRFRYKSPNGLESEMSAPSITKATVDYQNVPNAIDIAKRTELIVDKQNQTIKGLIKQQSDTDSRLVTAEQSIDGFKDTVSNIETKLENDIYTKEETNTQIKQSADNITSAVSTSITTAKNEAIKSANTNTDEKLKDYSTTVDMNAAISISSQNIMQEVDKKVDNEEFGTKIEQNWEHIKYAWNKITEFIQMEILNNNPSLTFRKDANNLLMALDKLGQHFYKSGNSVFGEMGVKTVDNQNYVAFSVPTDYNKNINDGMAWGITTASDNKFFPILSIKNFHMGAKQSDDFGGELILNSCNLVLGGAGSGIVSGNVLMFGDLLNSLHLIDVETQKNLLYIIPPNNTMPLPGTQNGSLLILDNMEFFANEGGTNSFRIGGIRNMRGDLDGTCCLMTDDGSFMCENITANNSIYCDGYVAGKAFSSLSLETKKKNIRKYDKNAINEIINTDIYTFNYKDESNNDKKTIGAVIGNNYKCSDLIISNDEKSINLYSMISLAYKAIQEQQEQINKLEERIKLIERN